MSKFRASQEKFLYADRAKGLQVHSMPRIPAQEITAALMKPKLQKKTAVKSESPVNCLKFHFHTASVASKVQYKELHKKKPKEHEMLPIVKTFLRAPYLIETQAISEVLRKSLAIGNSCKILCQPSTRAFVLQSILKILRERAEDISVLREHHQNLRTERKIISKVTAEEKARWKIEKVLIQQLKGERMHERSSRKEFISILKKSLKAFETKADEATIDIEIQVNLVMGQVVSNKSKELIQRQGFGKLLCCGFREDTLDLHFVIKMVVLYSRSEFQSTRKQLIEFLLVKLSSGAKRKLLTKHLAGSTKNYKQKYLQYGIEKVYSLLLANNSYIRKRIRRYNENYKRT